ncbi:hypothetical protein H8E77_31455 [bacterium]|nr:hypothetical protein [bacterium]
MQKTTPENQRLGLRLGLSNEVYRNQRRRIETSQFESERNEAVHEVQPPNPLWKGEARSHALGMAQKIILIFICSTVILFLTDTGWSYFPNLGAGARPMGMGGAYTGLADDANAPFFNPAGLTQLMKRELTAMYSMLYVGLNPILYTGKTDRLGYHLVSFVQPLHQNTDTMAVSWLAFNSAFYDENIFTLSYARCLYLFPHRQKFPSLSAGLNIKILNLCIETNEYTKLDSDLSTRGLSKSDATLDFSLLLGVTPKINLGLVAANIRPVNIGLIQQEEVPLRLAAGLSYREGNTLQLIDISWRNNLLNERKEINLSLGIEHWLFRQVCIRAGYNIKSISTGASYRYGYSNYEMQLDYAFIYPLSSLVNTYGTHRFALSVRF